MTELVTIDYYSDVLCVWAWIAERRGEELHAQWGDRVHIDHYCVNVFGDTQDKVDRQWAECGGFDGFADHVQHAASSYEAAPVHPQLWRRVRPATSATAHLVLKAAALLATPNAMTELATAIRRAFFVEAVDVGELDRLLEIAHACALPVDSLRVELNSGRALAALLSDYTRAEQQRIKGSPTWVLNAGRQVLYGNVGYRILHANVEELLRSPRHEASWC